MMHPTPDIRAMIEAIVPRLEKNIAAERQDFTYASGVAGQLLALINLVQIHGELPLDVDLIEEAVYQTLSALPKLGFGLFQGGAGTLLSLLEIDRHLGLGIVEDAAIDFDAYLLESLNYEQNLPYHFDLISGIAGVTVYATYRAQHGGSVELLHACVDRLRKMARHDETGSYWFTPIEWIHGYPMGNMNPLGCTDLGYAHGQTGVYGSLAYAIASGQDTRESTKELLREGLRKLREAEHDGSEGHFGLAVENFFHSRVAWCYGDFGALAALRLAAQALKDEGCDQWALRILTSMQKRGPEKQGFSDPWLCHGSFGAAWLVRCLGPSFEELATQFARTNRAEPEASLLYQIQHDDEVSLGILEGCSGALLTLAERDDLTGPLHWSLPFLAGRRALQMRQQ